MSDMIVWAICGKILLSVISRVIITAERKGDLRGGVSVGHLSRVPFAAGHLSYSAESPTCPPLHLVGSKWSDYGHGGYDRAAQGARQ